MGNVINEVEEYIDSLGWNAKGIKKTLIRAGIKGKIDQSGSCPLANALKKRFEGELDHIAVMVTSVQFQDMETGNWITAFLPKKASEFVKNFDNEKYPELIADESD